MSDSTRSLASLSPAARGRPRGRGRAAARATPASSRWPFRFLLAFTVVLVLAPQAYITPLRPFHLALVSVVLAALAYASDRLARGEELLPMTRATVLSLGLLALAVVTLPVAIWPAGSLHDLTKLYLKVLIVFWLLANAVDSVPKLRTVAALLTAMSVVLSLSGIASFFTGGFASEEMSHGLSRIVGYRAPLTANPNDLALMLNLLLPLAVALFFDSRRPRWRLALLLCMCLDVVAIVATYSRGGFLVLGCTGAVYLWKLYRRDRRAPAIAAGVMMLVAIPLLPGAYMARLKTVTDFHGGPTNSVQARWTDMKAAAHYAMYHPLIGAGLGMDILALNQVRGPTWTKVHDVYLQYAVELGLPGLLLFLLLLRECHRCVAQAERLARADQTLGLLAEGLGVSLIAFTIAAVFYPDAYEFYFYYIAGLALAAHSIAMQRRRAMRSTAGSRLSARRRVPPTGEQAGESREVFRGR